MHIYMILETSIAGERERHVAIEKCNPLMRELKMLLGTQNI